MADENATPSDEPAADPTEGVRLIPADRAAEAVERGEAVKRRGQHEKKYGDRPEAPPSDVRPAMRFPLADTADPSEFERPRVAPVEPRSADASGEQPVLSVGPPTGETNLPHWTEPATGEVPKVIIGDADDEAEAAKWAAFASSSPRWRDQSTDWERDDDEPFDFAHDETTRVGALDSRDRPTQEELLSFDDLEVPGGGPPTEERPPGSDPIKIQSGRVPGRVAAPRPAREGGGPVGGGAGGGPARPAALEGAGASSAGGGGRDLPMAIGVGVGIAAVALLLFELGPVFVMLLVLAIVVLATAEFFNAVRRGGFRPAVPLGLAAAVAVPLVAYNEGDTAIPMVLFLSLAFGLVWYLAGVSHEQPVRNLSVTVFGVMYVGMLASYAALLLRVGPVGGGGTDQGVSFLLLAVIGAVLYDVGGFFIGSRLGRTPLTAVSPNKTVEGLIGGMVTSVVAVLAVHLLFGVADPLDVGQAFVLALLMALAAPIGDLAESLLKRDLGIKDMGHLLPAHGGVLDRFDALLFVLPTAYYVLRSFDLI